MSMMDTSPKYDNISPLLNMELHKCLSTNCENQTNSIWCDKCMDELGEYIEQHPISSHKIPKTKIGKYSMTNHFDFLDDFVEKMKSKILKRDGKYGHQPTTEKAV